MQLQATSNSCLPVGSACSMVSLFSPAASRVLVACCGELDTAAKPEYSDPVRLPEKPQPASSSALLCRVQVLL